MRKLIMAVVLLGGCLTMTGCFTFDREHNRRILSYWREDIRLMHEDLDFILMMDEPPQLEIYMR